MHGYAVAASFMRCRPYKSIIAKTYMPYAHALDQAQNLRIFFPGDDNF